MITVASARRTTASVRIYNAGAFTVSFPSPQQIVLTSLRPMRARRMAASWRCRPSRPAVIDGVLVKDAYLHIECGLHRIVDDLGGNSLIIGSIVAAHAGLNPEAGTSAIVDLSHVNQKLFGLNHAEKEVTVNVGMIDSGLRPNVMASQSSVLIDVRVPTREDARRIEKTISNLEAETPGICLLGTPRFAQPTVLSIVNERPRRMK